MQDDAEPVELEEPGDAPEKSEYTKSVWMRGLMMLILALMFALAETVLAVVAVVQFVWMLFAREKNTLLAEFGQDLGRWLSDVAAFQSGATDDKPFPWKSWNSEDAG